MLCQVCDSKLGRVISSIYSAQTSTKILLCDQSHTEFSTVSLNLDYLKKHITEMETVFNSLVARIFQEIQIYKMDVYRTLVSYQKLAKEMSHPDTTIELLKGVLDRVKLPLDTFEMKRLLNRAQSQVSAKIMNILRDKSPSSHKHTQFATIDQTNGPGRAGDFRVQASQNQQYVDQGQ